MPRTMHYPFLVATKLSADDHRKLKELSAATERTPGDVLRQLLRLARPTGLPQITMAPLTEAVVPKAEAR